MTPISSQNTSIIYVQYTTRIFLLWQNYHSLTYSLDLWLAQVALSQTKCKLKEHCKVSKLHSQISNPAVNLLGPIERVFSWENLHGLRDVLRPKLTCNWINIVIVLILLTIYPQRKRVPTLPRCSLASIACSSWCPTIIMSGSIVGLGASLWTSNRVSAHRR